MTDVQGLLSVHGEESRSYWQGRLIPRQRFLGWGYGGGGKCPWDTGNVS